MHSLLSAQWLSSGNASLDGYLEPDQQMARALQPRSMAVALEQALGLQPPLRDRKKPARCRILDMKYRPNESCTILYELDEQLLLGLLEWREKKHQKLAQGQVISPLGMRLYRFEQDPALPGLATALDATRMTKLLNETGVGEGSGRANVVRCKVTPLRYRPGKRCTLHLDLWYREAKSSVLKRATLFGKLYHDPQKAQSVYKVMQVLSTARPLDEGQLVLAHAVGLVPELAMVLQAPVAGTPLDLLLSHPERIRPAVESRISDGVGRAAVALASLHQMDLSSQRVREVVAELAKLRARASEIATVDPPLGEMLIELMAAIWSNLPQLSGWHAESGLIHGDCKPSQFLIGPADTALLDFDHCGTGDPASDVGTFLATLRQSKVAAREPRQSTHWFHALEERFLEDYMSTRGCHPDLRRRATWYMALALLRKSLRSFARSPRSPLPAVLVEEAWRCLAQL